MRAPVASRPLLHPERSRRVAILGLAELPRGWEFEFFYRRHLRARGPAAEPFAQALHRLPGSLRNHFDGPVRQIARNAADA